MLIAIVSDIHDNLVNLKKFLSWCENKNIKKIICCGDITNSETLEFLALNFNKEIYLVRGNMEIYKEAEEKNFKNIIYLGRIGKFELDNKMIGVCHEPYLINKILENGEVDIIFYGHTHRPWIEEKNGIKLINPGTLGGVFQKATFAVWNTTEKEPELKILEEL